MTKADTVIAGVRLLRAESGNLASADDLHATVSYETNPTDVVFWYARSDTGYDNARLIDFFPGTGFEQADIDRLIDIFLEQGFLMEFECYDVGHLYILEHHLKKKK